MVGIIICTDPDAPNPEDPWRREWKHWLVCNIPGCSVGEGLPMAMFIPSGPPKGSPHRYTFIGKGYTFCLGRLEDTYATATDCKAHARRLSLRSFSSDTIGTINSD